MSLHTSIKFAHCDQLFAEIVDSIMTSEQPKSWEAVEIDAPLHLSWYTDHFVRGYIANKIFVEQMRFYGSPCSKQFICNYLKLDDYELRILIEQYELDIEFEVTEHFLVVNDTRINLEWCKQEMTRLLGHFPDSHFEPHGEHDNV